MKNSASLIIDSSEKNSDLYYRTNFFVPDPVIYIEHRKKKTLVLNDLELDRGREEAAVDEVIPFSSCVKKISKNKKRVGLCDVVDLVFREKKIKRAVVQQRFPIFFADDLRKRGYKIKTSKHPFLFPERLKKNKREVGFIKDALRKTALAMEEAISAISSSNLKNGKLYLNGNTLTSERIKQIIHSELIRHEFSANHTIVSCGIHSSMPHSTGEGPLFAGKPIVIDIFPRSQKNGYFGDMTRTVVKGEPTPELTKMYSTVLKGQKLGISMIKHGVKVKKVHNAILDFFEESGFKTKDIDGKPQGFIHSTGHGLGLDIHEPPRVSQTDDILEEGNVVTVEPGLYYEKMGGIRIEDVVLVTKDGCKNLTRFRKKFRV